MIGDRGQVAGRKAVPCTQVTYPLLPIPCPLSPTYSLKFALSVRIKVWWSGSFVVTVAVFTISPL